MWSVGQEEGYHEASPEDQLASVITRISFNSRIEI